MTPELPDDVLDLIASELKGAHLLKARALCRRVDATALSMVSEVDEALMRMLQSMRIVHVCPAVKRKWLLRFHERTKEGSCTHWYECARCRRRTVAVAVCTCHMVPRFPFGRCVLQPLFLCSGLFLLASRARKCAFIQRTS